MKENARYAGYMKGTARLRYPGGHLGTGVTMLESGSASHTVAQQFQALARAVANQMDHCLDTNSADQGRAEPAALTRYR